MNKLNLFPKPAFLERMKNLLPDEKDFQNYLEILKHEPVRSIRCNTLKISPDKLKKCLEEKGWKISQPWKNNPEVMIVEGKFASKDKIDKENNNLSSEQNISRNNYINNSNKSANEVSSKLGVGGRGDGDGKFEHANNLIPLEPGELGRSLEHLLGYYYIQELASMLPIIALAPRENELILDLAASPGSKTTQISARMNNTGTIIANEISLGRIKILASNLERCGCTNAIITKKDGIAFCERIKKYFPELKFDKILVDAPCSGEGTLRSTPKTYQMWNPKTIFNLSKLQKYLVASAIEILKPNGVLVYSTCTHAPEENEEVVDFVLEKFPEMKIEEIKLPIKCREGIIEWKMSDVQDNKERDDLNDSALIGWASGVAKDKMNLLLTERGRELGGKARAKSKKFSPEVKKSCRIYPHDADTEGFFIAKFKKIK